MITPCGSFHFQVLPFG